MKAFKNSNMFDDSHGPGGGSGGAAFMARAPVQEEAVFTVRAIRVTRVAIISNPTKVISSNSNNSPGIRVTQNS